MTNSIQIDHLKFLGGLWFTLGAEAEAISADFSIQISQFESQFKNEP